MIAMNLATYYRGRLSYIEALELSMDHFMTLRHSMYVESQSEDMRKMKENEALEDELEGMT